MDLLLSHFPEVASNLANGLPSRFTILGALIKETNKRRGPRRNRGFEVFDEAARKQAALAASLEAIARMDAKDDLSGLKGFGHAERVGRHARAMGRTKCKPKARRPRAFCD